MHGIPCPCPECGRPRQASRPDILCPRCHGLRLKKLRAPTVPCTVCGSPTRVGSRNAQQTFRETDWPTEVVVKTQMPRGLGYPTHYKIDIAHTTLQIAIEVDGGSHRSLLGLQRDAKKTAFLHGVGWTVLRFSNREVMEHLADCVQTARSII